jgi:hypothetical protein
MGLSTTENRQYLPRTRQRRRQRAGIGAGNRPEVLHEIYALARNVPPLLAAIVGWTQVHWQGVANVSGLETRSFTVRHVIVLLLMMSIWIRCFKGETIGPRATPLLLFISSQAKAVFMGTAGCTLLLWVERLISHSGKHLSIFLFAFRCATGGLLCVLLAAVVYEIVNRSI